MGGTSYFWDFGDGQTSTLTDPVHTYASGSSWVVTLIATNACGSDTISVVILIDAIQDAAFAANVSVFPNPNSGSFALQVSGLMATTAQVEVTTLLGAVIQAWAVEDIAGSLEMETHLPAVAPGIYFLRVQADGHTAVKKMIVR